MPAVNRIAIRTEKRTPIYIAVEEGVNFNLNTLCCAACLSIALCRSLKSSSHQSRPEPRHSGAWQDKSLGVTNLIHSNNSGGYSTGLSFIDVEKAFDSVEVKHQ